MKTIKNTKKELLSEIKKLQACYDYEKQRNDNCNYLLDKKDAEIERLQVELLDKTREFEFLLDASVCYFTQFEELLLRLQNAYLNLKIENCLYDIT